MSQTINVSFCKECDDKVYWAKKDGETLSTKDLCLECRKATDNNLKEEFIKSMCPTITGPQLNYFKNVMQHFKPTSRHNHMVQ